MQGYKLSIFESSHRYWLKLNNAYPDAEMTGTIKTVLKGTLRNDCFGGTPNAGNRFFETDVANKRYFVVAKPEKPFLPKQGGQNV